MKATKDLSPIHNEIITWYNLHGRKHLPWRLTRDPYRVYLSEIMLQQTQVKTVLERFYEPFLERFPTLSSLAQANKEEVLQKWQGLGYYTRAINLWNTAKITKGRLPSTTEELIELPGIGQNTAHAVACFAFGQPVSILEANVKRIVARYYAKETPSINELWQLSYLLLNKMEAYTHNQALMDIGSMVCTPKAPSCSLCPLEQGCLGKVNPLKYPSAVKPKATHVRLKNILVVRNSTGDYFLQQRTSRFLQGLFQFIECDRLAPFIFNHEMIKPKELIHVGNIQQTYSHFQLDADVFVLNYTGISNHNNWYAYDEMKALPLSKAETKIIELISTQETKLLKII